MATSTPSSRLVIREDPAPGSPHAVWWPRSRVLADSLGELFTLWPREAGRISRVLYSPPDWDDRPRAVHVPGRRVKTGSFPKDDTATLVVTMADHTRRTVAVVPPGASEEEASRALGEHSPAS